MMLYSDDSEGVFKKYVTLTEFVDSSFIKDYACTKDGLQFTLKSEGVYFMVFNKSYLNIFRRKTKISGYRARFWFDSEETFKIKLRLKPHHHLILDQSKELSKNCK